MSRSQDIAREMNAARQYIAGSNGVDDLPNSSVGFSRLCDDVAPVVTGQGAFTQEYRPSHLSTFWHGVVAATGFWLSLAALLMALGVL